MSAYCHLQIINFKYLISYEFVKKPSFKNYKILLEYTSSNNRNTYYDNIVINKNINYEINAK